MFSYYRVQPKPSYRTLDDLKVDAKKKYLSILWSCPGKYVVLHKTNSGLNIDFWCNDCGIESIATIMCSDGWALVTNASTQMLSHSRTSTVKTDLSNLSLFLYNEQAIAWKPASLKHKMFKEIKRRHTGFAKGDKIGPTPLQPHCRSYPRVKLVFLPAQKRCLTWLTRRSGIPVRIWVGEYHAWISHAALDLWIGFWAGEFVDLYRA